MTVAQPTAPHPADTVGSAVVGEPSRFAAYATGCDATPAGGLDRILRPLERLLVPELSRIARRRVSRRRSRS